MTFEIQLPQDDFNLLAWVLGEQIATEELSKSKDDYQLRGLSSEEHLLKGIISYSIGVTVLEIIFIFIHVYKCALYTSRKLALISGLASNTM